MGKLFDMDTNAIIKIIDENHLISVSIVIVLTFLLSYLLRKYLTNFIAHRSHFMNVDPTRYRFLKNASTAIVIGIALIFILYTIPALKSIGTTLFASAGAVAAVIALASQQAFSNIIGGVFLVIFRPFRVGDLIKINDQTGFVEDITLRHTVIRSYESTRIIIPNAVMSNEIIINSSIIEERVCRFIEFGISYDSSVKRAKKIITDEATSHPDFIDGRTEEETKNGDPLLWVRMVKQGDFSITLRAYFWCSDPLKAVNAHWDLLESVKERFDDEGIEIPYPYRTIVYKNDINGLKTTK